MGTDEVAAARRIAGAWGRAVGPAPMCIEATRYGIEALGRLGITARPMPCAILVLNHFAHSLAVRGVPLAEWPPWAHSVGVSPGSAPDEPLRRGWNGHLVVEGDDFIADLSLAAFSRPDRGLLVKPWAWAKGHDIAQVDQNWVAASQAAVVVLTPHPELAQWRTASAWRRALDEDFVNDLVAAGAGRPSRQLARGSGRPSGQVSRTTSRGSLSSRSPT